MIDQTLGSIIHIGSVKNIRKNSLRSNLIFEFSNRYSIFDWGEMPNQLEEKGIALSVITQSFFTFLKNPDSWKILNPDQLNGVKAHHILEKLKSDGFNHHGIGAVDSNGNISKELMRSPYYCVKEVEILKPKYNNSIFDYSEYKKKPTDVLVPMEVIFRFGIPIGSSLPTRLNTNLSYLRELNLNKIPKENEIFEIPIVEFSTKLEPSDRYLTQSEAQNLACLSSEEFSELRDLTLLLAYLLKSVFSSIGLTLWDGKFEFSFIKNKENKRDFQLVDSIGPDELRLTKNNAILSKELLRQFYIHTNWYKDVIQSKEIAKARGVKDWKKICLNELNSKPNLLNSSQEKLASSLYPTLANLVTKHLNGNILFPNAMNIDELLKNILNADFNQQ